MIICTTDSQKLFLSSLKSIRLVNKNDLFLFAKSYLGNSSIVDAESLLNSFTDHRSELEKYLAENGFLSAKEGAIETKETESVPKRALSASGVSPNFRTHNVRSLFTGSHVAGLYFEQRVNELLQTATYLGDPDSSFFAKPTELNSNIGSLKNRLFKEVVDFLILQKELKKTDFYETQKIANKERDVFLANLFSGEVFIPENYNAYYRNVMNILENYFLKNLEETILIPNSNQRIPLLKDRLDDTVSKKRLDAYVSAVLLQNFDVVVSTNSIIKNMLKADPSTFSAFESPIDRGKYSSKVEGVSTEYFMDDDISSAGVKHIQTKLVHGLVAIVPILDKDLSHTGQYLTMNDLYGLGAMLHEFQLKNFNKLINVKDWVSLEEDPIRMLRWYLDNIIKASEVQFVSTISNKEELNNSDYLDFKNKVNISRSILSFLDSIDKKEKNSSLFSMTRIITQPLINSVGATYSTDYVGKHFRKYSEMHSHNSERVHMQESMYTHLKSLESNWESINLSEEDLSNAVGEGNAKNVSQLVKKLTGLSLTLKQAQDLIDKWTADEGKMKFTPQEKLDRLKGVFRNILNILFPLKKSKDIENVFKASLIKKIKDNEDNIINVSYDDIRTHNDVINSLSEVAGVQDILDKKLESIVVRILSTISKVGGEAIPTTIIPSTGVNDIITLRERHLLENDGKSRKYKSYFLKSGALLGTVVRLESVAGDKAIDASQLNIIENFTSHFEFDFLESLKDKKDNENSNVNIMIGNYADKARILDKAILRDAKVGDKFIIRSPVGSSPKNPSTLVMSTEEILEYNREQSLNYYTDIVLDIINTYASVFNLNLEKLNPKNNFNLKEAKNLLNIINTEIRKLSKDEFLNMTLNSPNNFIKEVHYSFYGNKVSLNNNILDYLDIYSNKNLYDGLIHNQKESFLHKFLDYKMSNILISSSSVTGINTNKKGEEEDNMVKILHSLGIPFKQYKEKFIDSVGNHLVHYNGVLNPLVSKWLAINEFFRNEYLYIAIKPEYMHPVKDGFYREIQSDPTNVEAFLDTFNRESGARLSVMAKRNVSMTGSTELPTRKGRFSVPDKVNAAVIEDWKAPIPVLGGKMVNQDVHDGSTLIPYVYSKMIDHSYQGKGLNGTKKQLGTLITEFGSALKKDSESVLSNHNIRNSRNSPISLKDKQEQVFSIPITISEYMSGALKANNKFFKDGNYYAINSFKIEDNYITRSLSKYNFKNSSWENTLEGSEPILINNLFNLWESFGGEHSVDSDLKLSEGSNDLLFDVITKYEEEGEYVLKNKMIHILSNLSSFKSGPTNLHPKEYWVGKNPIKYMTYSNRHMGIQLDANHDIVSAKMKEVTQMMSALSQNPDTAQQAEDMYQELANTIERSIKKIYLKEVTKDKSERDLLADRYKTLSNNLVKSLNNSTNQGLAKVIAENFDYGQSLPFSNQNFFREFIKDLVVRLNKDFITRYYPGTGAILTPSHNIITIYEDHNGDTFSQEDITELAINAFVEGNSLYRGDAKTTDEIINLYLSTHFGNKKVRTSTIQLLDTVMVNGKVVKLDTLDKYYNFKNTFKSILVDKVYSVPRDLKPIEISFDVKQRDGKNKEVVINKNLFDLTSIKLKFINQITDPKEKEKYQKLLNDFKTKFKITNDEELLIKLSIWTQRELRMISKNRFLLEPKDLNTYFAEGDNLDSIIIDDYLAHYSSNKVSTPIMDYKKKAAELILGNIYSEVFKTGDDSSGKILSLKDKYFSNKLSEVYTFNNRVKADFKIATESRDVYVVLSPNGENVIENSENNRGNIIEDYNEEGRLERKRISKEGDVLYTIPEEATLQIKENYDILYIKSGDFVRVKDSSKKSEGSEENVEKPTEEDKKNSKKKRLFEFKKSETIEDTVDDLLGSFESGIEAIVPIMNNFISKEDSYPANFNTLSYSLFKKYSGYYSDTREVLGRDYLKKHKGIILEKLGKKMYASWEKSREFVASRIPAQSMQSFMEMKNVAYFRGGSNEAYVSVWQIVIQGSDFDIDKAYIMGHGFNKAGNYELWNDNIKFTNFAELDIIEKFPNPSGNIVKEVLTSSKNVLDISKELENFILIFEPNYTKSSLKDVLKIIEYESERNPKNPNLNENALKIISNLLRKIGSSKEVVIQSSGKYSVELNEYYKKYLLDIINNYNTSSKYRRNKFSQVNSTISNIKSIISNPANQLWANSPVDFKPFNNGADIVENNNNLKLDEFITKVLSETNEGKDSITSHPEIVNSIEKMFGVKVFNTVDWNMVMGSVEPDDNFDDASISVLEFIGEANRIKQLKNTLSAHDMISMFKQQSDAIIGKKDVGIGANGMKVMFALNNYYNKYYKSLKIDKSKESPVLIDSDGKQVNVNEDPQWFKKTFHMGDIIGTVHKNAVADVWMTNELHREIAKSYNIEGFENMLKNSRNGMAALYLSGFVSAATDNAKELIMAKINAINELAAMHTYLLIMGFTAEEVSIYMNSDIAKHILKVINSTSIYDEKRALYITDILKEYASDNKENAQLVGTFLDIYNGGQEVSKLAGLLKINQSTSADIESMYDYLIKFNKTIHSRENAVLNKKLLNLRSTEDYEATNKLIDTIIDNHPNDISKEYVIKTINNAANIKVYYIDKNGLEKQKYVSILGGQFDFRYYIHPKNKDYVKASIEYYNLFKNTFNVFHVIENSPHFKSMISGLSNVHLDALKVSKKYNFVFNTALDVLRDRSMEIYSNNKQNRNVTNYMGNTALPINTPSNVISKLLRGYDGFLVANWLKQGDLKNYSFSVKQLLDKLGEKSFKVYTSNNAKSLESTNAKATKLIELGKGEDFIIDLTTDFGIANFKKMMEVLVLPILKKSEKNKTGEFLRTQAVRNPYGMFTTQIVPTFGLSSLDNSVNVAKYQDLLYNFNQIDFQIEESLVIKNSEDVRVKYTDLFFIYNLIVNNEQYGDKRLTALMQDYVKDRRSIAYKYLNFSRSVDLRDVDIFEFDIESGGLTTEEYEELLHKFNSNLENDIIFTALNNRGKLNVKKSDSGLSREIVLKNSDFVINTFMDVTDSKDTKKYTDFTSFRALLRDSNLIINFKCV